MNGTVTVNASNLGTSLQMLLMADDITLGSQPGYQLCKQIYLFHPLGAKIAEKPIELAQSQKRKITVPDSPEQVVVEAFEEEWKKLNIDVFAATLMITSRIYGIGAIALMERGAKTQEPVDFDKLYKQDISFNVYDPLNVAGSLVLNQDPLAMDFQHVREISVSGSSFHRTRAFVQMHERPIYIEYQSAAFGFTGRSVYQRALFPLKTFISTMVADDMAARKVGLLVAMVKQAGSIIDGVMDAITSFKRVILQQGQTNNVLSIGVDDKIESLNLQNLDGVLKAVRTDVLENIASAVPMPAKLMTQETLAEGFGEGTEDAKQIAQFVDKIREQMDPLYEWMDKIVRYRAWNPDFYKTIQERFPDEYGKVDYKVAFTKWSNAFSTEWPSLLKEPDSELVKVDDVKLRAVVALLEVFLPLLDPENRMIAIEWACDAFNELKLLFGSPLNFDYDEMRKFAVEQEKQKQQAEADAAAGGGAEDGGEGGDTEDPTKEKLAVPKPPKPMRSDSTRVDRSLIEFRRSLDSLKKTGGRNGR
jgi:hypothetical protein